MKFGVMELLIILAVVLILFGPSQIPKLTKMFGKSVKNFKDGMAGDKEDAVGQKPQSSDEKE